MTKEYFWIIFITLTVQLKEMYKLVINMYYNMSEIVLIYLNQNNWEFIETFMKYVNNVYCKLWLHYFNKICRFFHIYIKCHLLKKMDNSIFECVLPLSTFLTAIWKFKNWNHMKNILKDFKSYISIIRLFFIFLYEENIFTFRVSTFRFPCVFCGNVLKYCWQIMHMFIYIHL